METTKVDKSFNQLMDVIQKVIDLKQRGNIVSTNPIYKYFRKFRRVYASLTTDEKKEMITKMYDKFKDEILSGKDDWILSGHPSIGYDTIKICVGMFYGYACEIRDTTKKELEGLPDSAYQTRNELIYPDIIKLHLYRIIHIYEKDEKNKLIISKFIDEIEDEVGLESRPGTDKNPMDNMMSMFSNMMSGAKGPGGEAKMPDLGNLSGLLGSFMNNPAIKEQFGSIIDNFKDIKSFEEILPKMSAVLNDPKVGELVDGMVSKLDPERRSATINGLRKELEDPEKLLLADIDEKFQSEMD